MMQRDQQPRSGFTLIELLVSIAIVVVLMVGVAQVFQYTGQAVGATQQMSEAVRNDRAIQSTLAQDFQGLATDGPYIQFRSRTRTAYRNRADEQSDKDGDVNTWNPTDATGLPGANAQGEVVIPAAQVNERNHRVDVIGFFSRGVFNRQTGNQGVFTAPMSSNEAWIWLGHLMIADNGVYGNESVAGNQQYNDPFQYSPGATPPFPRNVNPNNYYATQWVLGRVCVLLRDPRIVAGNQVITDSRNVPQDFIIRDGTPPAPPAPDLRLSPLNDTSLSTLGVTAGYARLSRCRFDLAGTSISKYRQVLTNFIGTQWTPGVTYATGDRVVYRGLSYTVSSPVTATVGQEPGIAAQYAWDPANAEWWSEAFGNNRFGCNPFVQKPLTSDTYSQQSPVFVQGCTQFIVEYAGDFLKQVTDPSSEFYGRVIDVYDNPASLPVGDSHTDGEIDFILTWDDANNDDRINPAERPSIRREVRWYGLPRDTRADGEIPGYFNTQYQHDLPDVVPLRDVVRTIASAGITPPAGWPSTPGGTFGNYLGAPFEKLWFNEEPSLQPNGMAVSIANPTVGYRASYMDVINDPTNANGMDRDEYYQCAWGPYDTVRPKMLRIIMTLDDPNSRLAEGQTFEYVYKLP